MHEEKNQSKPDVLNYWCPTELEYVKSTPSNIICTLYRCFHLIKTQISEKKKTSTQKSTHQGLQWAGHSAYMYISIKNISDICIVVICIVCQSFPFYSS